MTNTTHYNLKKFETTDKMRPTTLNALNSNFETIDTTMFEKENSSNKTTTVSSTSTDTEFPSAKAVFGATGVINHGGSLAVNDGSVPSLTNNRYYYISGLSVNNSNDSDFSFAIIFYWTSGTNRYIDLVDKYTKDGADICVGKRWKYDGNTQTWSVFYQRNITYSTTDLTAGTSPLPTGSLYFVYE